MVIRFDVAALFSSTQKFRKSSYFEDVQSPFFDTQQEEDHRVVNGLQQHAWLPWSDFCMSMTEYKVYCWAPEAHHTAYPNPTVLWITSVVSIISLRRSQNTYVSALEQPFVFAFPFCFSFCQWMEDAWPMQYLEKCVQGEK